MNQLALGIVWYVVFLLSTTLHEAAHAWVAKRGGDLTAYEAGQVSLDPRPHLQREPWGMILVPILSFIWIGFMMGWASSPYNPDWARAHPHRAAKMALAGPITNMLLVVIAGVLIRVGLSAGWFDFPLQIRFDAIVKASEAGMGEAAALFLSLLFSLNVLLAVLNLIPLPPLDGSGAIGLFLSEANAVRVQEVMQQPLFSIFGMLAAFFLIGQFFWPIWGVTLHWLYSIGSY